MSNYLFCSESTILFFKMILRQLYELMSENMFDDRQSVASQ